MLRRIHDPERGASFLEYTGVIVLVAAIMAAVVFSGLGGQISSGLTEAVDRALGGESDPGSGDTDDVQTTSGDEGDGDGAADEDGTGEGNDGGTLQQVSGDGGGGGGGFWGGVGDGIGDVFGGLYDAGEGFVTDVGDGAQGLWEGAQELWDDPGQWASDTWDDTREGVGDSWDALTSDPGGFITDIFVSEEAREDWENGDRLHAGSQVVGDTLIGFIPFVGWGKKIDRVLEVGGGGNRDNERDSDPRADGDNEDNEDQDGPSCPPGNSFVPGTPVVLADGTLLPIELVEVGDEVLATDPLTGETGAREVTHLIGGAGAKTLVDITVTDTDGATAGVTATDEHPFWAPDLQRWVHAIDLEPGGWLQTSDGVWVQVSTVETRTATDQRVHNLTVAGPHTYHVAAGNAEVLVHNTNDDDCVDPDVLADIEEDAQLINMHTQDVRLEELGFSSESAYVNRLTEVMTPGSGAPHRPDLQNDRRAWYDRQNGMIVIVNDANPTRSTAYTGTMEQFNNLT